MVFFRLVEDPLRNKEANEVGIEVSRFIAPLVSKYELTDPALNLVAQHYDLDGQFVVVTPGEPE